MSGQTVLVLGGGFGGAAAALAARRALGEGHQVRVIDRTATSRLCGKNPLVMVGLAEATSRSITELVSHGIDVVTTEITVIDLDNSQVATEAGTFGYDYLVVALGASYDWDAVEGAASAYSFYEYEEALRLADRLAEFRSGSIVLGIAGSPYKCPPAPFEGMMMIDWVLRERGIRDECSLSIAIPEQVPLAIAGPPAAKQIREAMEARGIELHTGRALTAVQDGKAEFSDGTSLPGDVVIHVPRHVLPPVVAHTGLAGEHPWIPVLPGTLETMVPDVFAIGDSNAIPVGTMAVPKAGTFASGQGVAVGARIASRITEGESPTDYDGTGYCYVSFGAEAAALVGGTVLAPSGPEVHLGVPSPRAMAAKRRWEGDWEAFRI